MIHSTKLFTRAQTVIPGGVNSPVRAFKSVGGTPVFFESGKGAYLKDVDGKKYIDYVNSWGALILGHADPLVLEALNRALLHGLSFGAPTEIEVKMAELITELMPSLEKVRMVNSGTEATQTAIRLARGFTKRQKILKFEGHYHGHADSLLMKAGSGLLTQSILDSEGIPNALREDTLIAPFNNLTALKTLFEHYGSDIAAVIVEPIACNMNCILPLPHFLQRLRELCDQYGSLLIFDEVITGFRVGLGGAQALYNVKPELTCLGKIIGGGLPVGAFGGKKEVMNYLAPEGPVYQAGTLSGNPIALTAGFTTLQQLKNPGVYENLEKTTRTLTTGIAQIADEYGMPLQIHQIGSLWGLFFTEKTNPLHDFNDVKKCDIERFKRFFHKMLEQGIYLAPSAFESGFVSTAHTSETIDQTLSAFKTVISHF